MAKAESARPEDQEHAKLLDDLFFLLSGTRYPMVKRLRKDRATLDVILHLRKALKETR